MRKLKLGRISNFTTFNLRMIEDRKLVKLK